MKQAPRYARAFGGHRVTLPIPFIRGKKYAVMAAITHERVLAAVYGEWSTNTDIF